MTLAVAALTSPTSTAAAGPAVASSVTPIKHVVVIFQENVSFDHYFGTYPNAANTDRPAVHRAARHADGRRADLARTRRPAPLTHAQPERQVNPRRSTRQPSTTCSPATRTTTTPDEQKAFDDGAMDKFVQTVGNGAGSTPTGAPCVAGDVMNYYDGNTVTGAVELRPAASP